jgi:cystathionine beta-lyase/cystathionine gamma-synthase
MSGFSSLFSFISYEPTERLKDWATKLKYFKIGVSWGGFESLVTVNRLGSDETGERTPTVVRIYVGMESPKDLIADMDQAWQAV